MASVPHFNERGFVRDLHSLAEVILLDHSYAKPWSAHPDASKVRPVKTLFLPKEDVENLAAIPGKRVDEELIDVCEPVLSSYSASIMYDTAKAKTVMAECEKYVSTVSSKKTPDTWEEQISRNGWGSKQSTLFDKVIKVLSNLRLSRLTYESLPNEPVMRRITTDKATKRLRQILSDTEWDPKLVSWLHSTLVDGLSIPLLACYLDVLQTLRAKVPTLVDRMMIQPCGQRRGMAASTEALSLLLKRPWDPAHGLVTQHKQRKLPGTPLLLVVPCGPTTSIGSGTSSKRTRFWHNQLSVLGKVVPVTMHTSNGGSGVSISQCLDHIIGAVRIKVLELRSHFPNRPIILLGWSVGALVSCQVALMESVCAVVCLGFPITGLSGVRVGVEDPLLELKTPTLFIIGSHSTLTSQEDVEEMREKMKTDTSLLVVGGADEQLRLTRAKKKQEGLTQNMVDRLIMDEIGDFLGNVLTSMNTSSHHRNDSSDVDEVDVRKKKRKRSVSRDLSTDMERSLTKQITSSHSSPKRPATQKSVLQDSEKTLLKLPLGNTMGALSTLRSLSQPSPAKRPRTSKPKSKAASPSASVIHVTGAPPNGGSVGGLVQAVPAHPGVAQGLPLHATATPRQVPFSSSSSALGSVTRGQTFISLTPKSSDGGTRVTQTFITIPRGSSPTVISSTPGGGQTVQYIIKPQSQRQHSGSLGAVGAALAAERGIVASSSQLPVRTIVSAAVRHTPVSQSSSSSSFTSVVGLKGNTVTTTSSSLHTGSLVSSNVKFTATSGSPTSGRPPFPRITTDVSQPSTISLLTKGGNTLVVSQPISSTPLKGSYKLVTGSVLGGATLQAVGGATTPLVNQPQIVVGRPAAISAQSVVGQRTAGGQGLKFSTPTGTAVSLPVSLAALAGKVPNSSSTTASPADGATLVHSSQVTFQPRTAPSQIVTLQRPAASSPIKTSVPVTSPSTTLTLTKGGITYVTRTVPIGTQAAVAQTGASQVAGKLVGNTVVCVQSVPKVVPTYVVAKSSVSETKTVASSQPSVVLSPVKPVTVSTERQTGKQAVSSTATTGPNVPPAVPVAATTGSSLLSAVSITSSSTCRLPSSVSGAATAGASLPSIVSTTSVTGVSLLSASHATEKESQGLSAGRQIVGAAPLEQSKASTDCQADGRSLPAGQAATAPQVGDSLNKKKSLQ